MQKKLAFLFTLMFLAGCASNRTLGPVPIDSKEFKTSIETLNTTYPDLDVYRKNNVFIGYCTPIKQLTKLWGEPDQVKTVWLQIPIVVLPIVFIDGITTGGMIATGIAYGMYPKQPKHYIWRKGRYEIDAYVTTEIGCGYEPRLWHWEWKPIAAS
ncbi:MAG: hypothetical protein ACOY4D_06030 [Pseudomonadota bacterium]